LLVLDVSVSLVHQGLRLRKGQTGLRAEKLDCRDLVLRVVLGDLDGGDSRNGHHLPLDLLQTLDGVTVLLGTSRLAVVVATAVLFAVDLSGRVTLVVSGQLTGVEGTSLDLTDTGRVCLEDDRRDTEGVAEGHLDVVGVEDAEDALDGELVQHDRLLF